MLDEMGLLGQQVRHAFDNYKERTKFSFIISYCIRLSGKNVYICDE